MTRVVLGGVLLLALAGCDPEADPVDTGDPPADADPPAATDTEPPGPEDTEPPGPADTASPWIDQDGDGWFTEGTPERPADCDDADPARNPGEPEVCDGVDNDCDERIDDADEDRVGAARSRARATSTAKAARTC